MTNKYYTVDKEDLFVSDSIVCPLHKVKYVAEIKRYESKEMQDACEALMGATVIKCKPIYLESGLLVGLVYRAHTGERATCVLLSTLDERALTESTFSKLFSYDDNRDCYVADSAQFYRFHNSIVCVPKSTTAVAQAFFTVKFEGKTVIVLHPILKKVCKLGNWYYEDDIEELTELVKGTATETASYRLRYSKGIGIVDKKVKWHDSISITTAALLVDFATNTEHEEYYIPVFNNTDYMPIGYVRNDCQEYIDNKNDVYAIRRPGIQYSLKQAAVKCVLDAAACKYLATLVKAGEIS